MKLDSNLYIHDSDKAALAALKAIPGFDAVVKAFMKVWSEKQYKLVNMSSNLKLSEKQLAKYYNLLPPICEKLGIEIPELYVELDVYPNAYTFGDTNPFIVLTSGLFETIPEELIPSVIAHECGHIACHHTLYTTMGSMLKNAAVAFLPGLSGIALYPIQIAFAYWMRCSELSADRAAMICDGSADKVIETCMRFAGYDKDIMDEANTDLFIQQAVEYKEYAKDSVWNKTLEFLQFNMIDHPQNAVRALEAKEWAETDRFKVIQEYLHSSEEDADRILPIYIDSKKYLGKNIQDVYTELSNKGATNIIQERVTDADIKTKDGAVTGLSVDDNVEFVADWIKRDAKIILKYYEHKTEEEIAREHLGEIRISGNAKHYTGRLFGSVEQELRSQGFTNIEIKEMALPIFGVLLKEHNVAKIVINGVDSFNDGDWFKPDAKIVLYFYVKV